MNSSRRSVWMVGGLVGLLLASCFFSYTQVAAARRRAERAADQHAAVAQALHELESLRDRPDLAAVGTERSAQLTRHLESTAAEAGIPADQIERVQTQPPRRLEAGPYLRQPTHVLLRQVGLPELLAFLHDLDAQGQTFQIDDLRLIAPHDQLTGDRWRAEFTVSYLVYEPLQTRNEDDP